MFFLRTLTSPTMYGNIYMDIFNKEKKKGDPKRYCCDGFTNLCDYKFNRLQRRGGTVIVTSEGKNGARGLLGKTEHECRLSFMFESRSCNFEKSMDLEEDIRFAIEEYTNDKNGLIFITITSIEDDDDKFIIRLWPGLPEQCKDFLTAHWTYSDIATGMKKLGVSKFDETMQQIEGKIDTIAMVIQLKS